MGKVDSYTRQLEHEQFLEEWMQRSGKIKRLLNVGDLSQEQHHWLEIKTKALRSARLRESMQIELLAGVLGIDKTVVLCFEANLLSLQEYMAVIEKWTAFVGVSLTDFNEPPAAIR